MRRLALLPVLVWLAWPLLAGEARPGISKELQTFLSLPESELNLGKGALLVCKEEYPALQLNRQLEALNALSDKLAAELARAGTIAAKLEALRTFLFETEKFSLPKKDDVSDFLLSEVMKNKRGNCLGLSVLCLALAERTGLKLHGVPVPSRLSGAGHLLVRYDDGKLRQNFDPTQGGKANPDEYYVQLFKLRPQDLKGGYILGNATRKDVLCLLLVNLGGARVEAGRPQAALPLLEAAAALNPNYAPAYNNIGAARLRGGDLAGAELAYKSALVLQAGMVSAQLGLAEVALRRGDLAGAEKGIQAAQAEEPDNIQARSLQAGVHAARTEWGSAAALLAEVVKLAPTDVRARCNLARVYLLSSDLIAAEAAYREAVALDEQNADAHFGLGTVLRASGKLDAADAEFAAALKIDPAHAPTLLADAQAALAVRRFDIAAAGFEKVLANDATNFDALNGLCKALLADKRPAEAIKRLNAALKEQPQSPPLHALAADVLMSGNEWNAALKVLESGLARAAVADKPPLLQRLGMCYGKQNLHRKALETAEQILKGNAKDLPALRLAATAAENMQLRDKALAYHRRVLEIEPDEQASREAVERLGR